MRDLYTNEVKAQINGKVSYGLRLEDLMLLKCPYYSKLPKDSIQSISKFQWHFFLQE